MVTASVSTAVQVSDALGEVGGSDDEDEDDDNDEGGEELDEEAKAQKSE